MATKKGLGAKGLGIEALIHNKMEDFESDGGGVMESSLIANSPESISMKQLWKNWQLL